MTDAGGKNDVTGFQPFEGLWLIAKPTLGLAYAKIVGRKLLVAFSSDERKLTGHFFDCRVEKGILYCRFEHFDSARAGVTFLAAGPNHTLRGGRWMNEVISETDRNDPSRWSETLPGMQVAVWIRNLKTQVPEWAQKYFQEDWPNKD